MDVERLKFHLDENLPNALANALRRRGVDVTTTPEQELRTASDETQLAFACSQGRVLVTSDSDFLRLHAHGRDHAGIVFVNQRHVPLGRLTKKLLVMWRTLSSHEMIARIQFL